MQGALRFIEQALMDKLFTAAAPVSSFEKGGKVLIVLSAFFALIGSGFVMYAGHLWLANHYSPEMTAAMTGLMSFAFAAFIAGLFYIALRYRQSRIAKIRMNAAAKIKSVLAALDDEWGDPIREYPKTALLVATVTGFILEERIF